MYTRGDMYKFDINVVSFYNDYYLVKSFMHFTVIAY